MLGDGGLLEWLEPSRPIRGRLPLKMLVMLLFHFHELRCKSPDRASSFAKRAAGHTNAAVELQKLLTHKCINSSFFSRTASDFQAPNK